ncbi:FkbM family methyltransferase [Variovorax arabinosiphilus]|uniref:FkbM family methyltransferase n=1 Tax=Variovorax arabinosiphilus TaxID=3053498 RepID=UPI002578BC7D|nr:MULTISPECIES: FkbM family methyltransferase [unclassified Variovorax]MDM0122285.1 FkbM family methyltransferase [Variovorax sp. J2L1-78]MDM0131186.1 FkbM family methyltransferase [Variovorax sp. J2L1-63]MDM0235048.1 FkbM family methyltransferase [Variovorax sp. J2R1-6]
MIARLFPPGHQGFYIDIGAADPVYLSVTKHFYDAGWQGINVEPLPRFFARIETARPRDINLNAIIGNGEGMHHFFEIEELPENSTSDEQVMAQLKEQGRTVRDHEVQVISLKALCEKYATGREIDFMKIDVEGGELAVLESADWQRFRPVLLVIEAVVVNGREETWAQWEHMVTEQGYAKVWFDGLNNYYLRQESLHLREHFRLPPNVFDAIELAHLDFQGNGWEDLSATVKRIDADRIAKQEALDRLIPDLTAANADREAKQVEIDRLVTELAAKQQTIDELSTRVAELDARRWWRR